MHHTSLSTSPTYLRSQVQEALDLAVHVPVGNVPAILAPFAGQDTPGRRIRRHSAVADEGQTVRPVQPGSAAAAGREELVLERGVDDADDGTVVENEGDGDAEHGEEVGVVDGAW